MTKTQTARPLMWALVVVCLAALFVPAASAQELRGSVRGVVADASGAVIPGSTVTLSNDNTGVEVVRETNAVGQYVFDFISPGTYTLKVESEGFRTFVQQNILVQTRADITVNAAMELGAVAETITVEDTPVAVSFNKTTLETTIDTKMTNNLPLVNRNPFMLAQLNPAVNYTGGIENSPYHHWAASQLDVGGNTSRKNDVLVDGVPQLVGAKSTYAPPMDAVAEVSVQQNAVDAEYGHSAGGIISVQMKSGTNDFHGTAYYFGRNPRLNARPNSTNFSPSVTRVNTWGGTSQNPIVKNKLFNFFAYEGTKLQEPRTQDYQVPTQLERTGDFSQTLVKAGQVRTIFDPWSGQFDAANDVAPRTPFPGNVIPNQMLDPTAVKMMNDIWSPNNSNNINGANNYRATSAMAFKYFNVTDRVDWNVKDNLKIFARVSIFGTDQTESNFVGSPALRKSGSERDTAQGSGDIVWTINPTTVFNVRGSYSQIIDSFNDDEAKIGTEGLEAFWPGNPWYQSYLAELPAIYYPGIDIRASSRGRFGRDGFWFQEPSTWNFQSKVSKQMGRHYMKIGGEFRQQRVLAQRPRPMGFRFARDETADDGIDEDTKNFGAAYASFLLGIPTSSSASRIESKAMNRPRTEFFAFFFQDDVKVNQRVTLNLGLRWEYETALKDPERRLSRDLDLTNPIPELQGVALPDEVMAIRGSAPNYVGAWNFTSDDQPGAWNVPKNLFLPRAGVAIRINDRTALRIGYARYAVPPIQDKDGDINILGSTPYQGFEASSRTLGPLEGSPRVRLNDPFPTSGVNQNPLVPVTGKSSGRYTNLGGGGFWFRNDYKIGVNERINISLQRQVWNRFVVDLTWFMNFGYNHALVLDGNELLPNLIDPRFGFQNGATVNQKVSNPFYQLLPEEQMPGPLRNQKTVSLNSLLSPFPHYGKLEQSPLSEASNRYSALQIQVQRPFANGFNLLLGYNYNRARDQSYFDNQDRFDQNLSWFDSYSNRHRLTIGTIYELPFGRGRKFGTDMNKVADHIVGGWSVSGIFVYRGGRLLRFSGTDLVNGDPTISNPSRTRWFNTDVFEKQPSFTRRTNPHQFDGIRGPRWQNLDLVLTKVFKLSEKFSFELKMEGYNITNSFMGDNPSTSRTAGTFGVISSQLRTHKGREFMYSGRIRW